jgi:hypothetical protein
MIAVTAESSSVASIPTASYHRWPVREPHRTERYVPPLYYHVTRTGLSGLDIIFDAISTPSLFPPKWLAAVDRRIRASVNPRDHAFEAGGKWLSPEVATAAAAFFRDAADLLPDEPYIYPSLQGDLIGEFECPNGTLTIIVSTKYVILFANVSGLPVEHRVENWMSVKPELRRIVHELTEKLRTG